ncbi:hypothetical protein JD969_15015 [Planctomycetota bacterium]|nr:hypothetical protein JD969_15015 [Planctomycetota bacterium]
MREKECLNNKKRWLASQAAKAWQSDLADHLFCFGSADGGSEAFDESDLADPKCWKS